jgi:hypothetical protein
VKVYQVTSAVHLWTELVNTNRSFTQKKTFATKEKAEKYYSKLYDAANLIGIGACFHASIDELEIE